MDEYRLTTKDNPYDPFENFTEWVIYDKDHGYDTCEYLARVSNADESMSSEKQIFENNKAIDEIIKNDPIGIYKKVSRSL